MVGLGEGEGSSLLGEGEMNSVGDAKAGDENIGVGDEDGDGLGLALALTIGSGVGRASYFSWARLCWRVLSK